MQLKKISRLHGIVAGVAAVVLVTVGVATPAHATEGKNRCGFVTLIGVRGSNEPAGVGTGASPYIYGYGLTGLGETVVGVAALRRGDANIPVYVEALKYPATIYPGVGKDDTNYLSSEQEGTRNLKAEMNDLASRCPNTSVQLVGYSQGAQVIANVLQAPSGLSATAKANLRGVALFADPTYRAGEPWDVKGNGPKNGLFTRDKGAFNAWTGWSTTSATKVNLVHSYCLANDFFCQGGGSMDVHNSYRNRTDLLGAADTWLRSFLVSA